MTTKILLAICFVLGLIVIFLLMRDPKTIIKADVDHETRLAQQIAHKRAVIDSIFQKARTDSAAFALKLAQSEQARQASSKRAITAEAKLREFMSKTPDPERDTLINQALAAKTEENNLLKHENQTLTDRVAQQGATIVDLQANIKNMGTANVQLIALKDAEITQAHHETKVERRKKVISRVLGIGAVIAVVIVAL